ncbi:hypothetical protein HN014_14755 [Aquimarina sp. TRL1]|uniref:hypothetical protein n=1 Tax=Aquimarina sp. (strain TRL1) TaxID=2736252 RepID=UPI00158C4352|nr:hypothetical protein [Aquimarina sp. TRL1]QKX06114.1 hypothetical protein HN014_14755 [Aquimarina sp. TRL1]
MDRKQTSNSLAESVEIDSITPQLQEQQIPKTLKEKLVGKTYRKAFEIKEFSKYNISGGFSLEGIHNNENTINNKEYSICRLRGKDQKTKILVLEEVYKRSDDGKSYFKILDLLELDKETDVFKKFPNKDIDIFSDVLLNGNRAPELLALAEYEETDIMTNVYKVWRANRKTGKFEEVKDISGITVVNEDY